MKLFDLRTLTLAMLVLTASGCALVPQTRQRDAVHNPFPQLKRIAVLPFFNQSQSPHVDGAAVGRAYYAALQEIPGFEVMPVGVAEIQFNQFVSQYGQPSHGADFQRLAKLMGVEAVVVGSVTDFDSYYPPRIAMTTHWYAANEGFHAIPPGYGLPWGTKQAEKIPARIVRETEFELARSQLKTQIPVADVAADPQPAKGSPELIPPPVPSGEFDFPNASKSNNPLRQSPNEIAMADYQSAVAPHQILIPGTEAVAIGQGVSAIAVDPVQIVDHSPASEGVIIDNALHDSDIVWESELTMTQPMPVNWPDPTDLIPDPPLPTPPPIQPQTEPVLTHTRLYRGDDPYFTERLADYVETADDARPTSWQGYIKRNEDFVRFCCHLHIVEMLEARGGRDASDVILRWPVSRY